jgi:catechol 2,3-dioxygenase-like lactoylglutathione lyase family enzyme
MDILNSDFIREKLEKARVPFEIEWRERDGKKTIRLRDPDGYLVEIFSPK